MSRTLKEFTVSTRSNFVDPTTKRWVQRGDWRPTYYTYEWVDDDQYLIVSDEMNVEMFGKVIPLNTTPDEDVHMKDLQHLEKPGTYYCKRKKRTIVGGK